MLNTTFKPENQAVRKQRVLMSAVSYMLTGGFLSVCWLNGYLDGVYLLQYFIYTAVANSSFFLLFHWNLNRFFRDPNVTFWQMFMSILPALYVMIFIENNQARSSIALLAMVPLLYGVMGLDTRRFILMAIYILTGYVVAIVIITRLSPGLIEWRAEVAMATALVAVIVQMALLGGYISTLRKKLKQKNQQLNEALSTISEIANKDELTGSRNRRFIVNQVAEEYDRFHRGSKAFSVVLIDLDYFKQINDTFGHLAGDQVLRRTAEICGQGLRKSDCLGRYGGEEFLLLLPQTDLNGAAYKAEQIRKSVESLDFSDICPDLRVTTSAGVATFTGDESYWDTIDRADRALYESKRAGRNCVTMFTK